MSFDLAMKVENLSKRYFIYSKPFDRLKHFLFGTNRRSYREFWALLNVSFEVKKGETVGIIGRNGAGKSTLLQLICGVLNPTSGSYKVNGKVAALLELGAGFNPEFTGRENVLMSAALYGLNACEIDDVLEEIIKFSEIEEFIDQPVKTYSSGMFVRLAFAVIAHVRADILIVDEALSVGDAKFQQKCNRFLEDFKKKGGSILFVSHDITLIRAICDRVVYLRKASSLNDVSYDFGDSVTLAKKYIEDLYLENSSAESAPVANIAEEKLEPIIEDGRVFSSAVEMMPMVTISQFLLSNDRFGNGSGQIVDAKFINADGSQITNINLGDNVCFTVLVKAVLDIKKPTLALIIKDRTGNYLFSDGTAGNFGDDDLFIKAGEIAEVKFNFIFPYLINGEYTLDISFADGEILDHDQLDWVMDCIIFSVGKGRNVVGLVGFSDYHVTWNISGKKQIGCLD